MEAKRRFFKKLWETFKSLTISTYSIMEKILLTFYFLVKILVNDDNMVFDNPGCFNPPR